MTKSIGSALFALLSLAYAAVFLPCHDDSTFEPYPCLHGGAFTGAANPFTDDPLATYVWSPTVNQSLLQGINPT